MKTVVLFSGGMDSTVLLTHAVRNVGAENVLALSIMYGSLHNKRESVAAEEVCQYLGVSRQVINLPSEIFAGGSSALLGEVDMPKEEYHDPLKETPSATIVPFRNAVLISIATAVADARGYGIVTMAAHLNDAVGYAYPDCMPEFLNPMAQAVAHGTLRKVRLEHPYTHNTKSDLVTIGSYLRAPLVLSWSCYRGEADHCGQCPTCRERTKAFHDAGYMDPTKYVYGYGPIYTGKEGLQVFPPSEKP